MREDIARKWIAELRSGKHKQGRGRLCTDDGAMCCLGVLQKVVLNEKVEDWEIGLSCRATAYAGTAGPSPRVARDGGSTALANLNDGTPGIRRHTFAEIADIIEKDWENL